MIAVDEHLKPTAIKPLVLHTHEQKRRFYEAKLRREMRMQFAKEHKERKQKLHYD